MLGFQKTLGKLPNITGPSSSFKGHGNDPNFPRFLHKSLWPRSLTLHFGFEFAEIFVFEKRLPVSVRRGVDKIAYRYNYFQTFK